MQTQTQTQQRGMPRGMPGYGGMPMGGYGGFGGQQPGGAFLGPSPMLPAANPWTGQAGAGAGPPGMGGYTTNMGSGATPAWAEPWSMTGVSFGDPRAAQRLPRGPRPIQGARFDQAALDRNEFNNMPHPFDRPALPPTTPTADQPQALTPEQLASLREHYTNGQAAQAQLTAFSGQEQQRQIALARSNAAPAGDAFLPSSQVLAREQALPTGGAPGGPARAAAMQPGSTPGQAAAGTRDIDLDPAYAGMRSNNNWINGTPEQRAVIEQAYRPAPVQMTAEQLQGNHSWLAQHGLSTNRRRNWRGTPTGLPLGS
jgi:hypothetical protein